MTSGSSIEGNRVQRHRRRSVGPRAELERAADRHRRPTARRSTPRPVQRPDRRPRRRRARSTCARRTARSRSTASPATVNARASNGPISVEGEPRPVRRRDRERPDLGPPGRPALGRPPRRARVEWSAHGQRSVGLPVGRRDLFVGLTRRGTAAPQACRGGNRDWDERSRSLRIGADPVVVKLTTVNGPVTVNER